MLPGHSFKTRLIFLAAALLICGCKKNSYRADRFYEAGGKRYAFTVAVENGTLYISGMLDGEPISGSQGAAVPEGKFSQVEVADLNGDGDPEVYAFYPQGYSWRSGVYAASCGVKGCVSIGMEDAAAGKPPADYCGEDAYSMEKDAIVRQYTACPAIVSGPKKLGHIRYKLVKTSFGLVLKS